VSTFVLIHGAWHGGWSWDKLVPHMQEYGHDVKAPDLPGHGDDSTPLLEVSRSDYIDRACQMIDESDEPVTLVGHSLGGIVISEAAEQRPEKIDDLVYLAAFMLPNGQGVLDVAQQDTESILWQRIEPDEATGALIVRAEKQREIFYHDCSEEDVKWAKRQFQPQPPATGVEPVEVTDDKFGSVNRAYIQCLQDRVIGPSMQEKMYTELPCEPVITMNTGHFPQISAPEALARHLDSLARRN
jgi:pimeloyl-ACP methyl ester carboxylesterase